MDSISDLTTGLENVGGPPELSAQINKNGVAVFAGVSGLDLTSMGSADITTIQTAISDAGGPEEVVAQFDKVSSLLLT